MIPKDFIEGRIVGGHSLHPAHNPQLCKRGIEKCGHWRTVDCCRVEEDRDIIECSKCGEQRSAKCNFDDEYS